MRVWVGAGERGDGGRGESEVGGGGKGEEVRLGVELAGAEWGWRGWAARAGRMEWRWGLERS